MEQKSEVVTNLFEGSEIRSVWDAEKEDYYYSVVDVIAVLTESKNPRNYWNMLKSRLIEEGSELYTNCVQFKLKAQDGKLRLTDTLDTEGIFRLIESVPSKNAEPFKIWFAKLGRREVDSVFDPSVGIDKMIDYYLAKGYSLDWIKIRVLAIIDRKKLTFAWHEHGIDGNLDYAILTNEIYKEWSGMTAQEYKSYKNIKKENLRDNMTDIEVSLTNLGEVATRKLVNKHHPIWIEENKKMAKIGGNVAKTARDNLEKELGETIISKSNALKFEYIDKNLLEDTYE